MNIDFLVFNFQWEILLIREDEEDEMGLVRGSLKHERWWRGGVTAMEDGDGSSSTWERRRARESWGERIGGAMVVGGPRWFI
jgi:hypothetical protein